MKTCPNCGRLLTAAHCDCFALGQQVAKPQAPGPERDAAQTARECVEAARNKAGYGSMPKLEFELKYFIEQALAAERERACADVVAYLKGVQGYAAKDGNKELSHEFGLAAGEIPRVLGIRALAKGKP